MLAKDIDTSKFDRRFRGCTAYMQPVHDPASLVNITHHIIQIKVKGRGAFNAPLIKNVFLPCLFDDIGEARKAIDIINAWAAETK